MSRWAPDARARLERAAVDLFAEQGFAATTVPQITERAGLTTRTFFRHFADKREVLFAGDEIPDLAARLVAESPPDLEPIALVLAGLHLVAETRFNRRREEFRLRRRIIRSDDGLQERDLRKRAALAEAIRHGLRARGEDDLTAALAAETAIAVLHLALDRWLDADTDQSLTIVVSEVFDTYRHLLASAPVATYVRDTTSATPASPFSPVPEP